METAMTEQEKMLPGKIYDPSDAILTKGIILMKSNG